jgi:glycosyltransferase involved in cell wall biosynthesis
VEFIFVDNGSTDGSFEHLGDLGPDTKLFSLPGRSIGAVRNFGAKEARGRYISFIDADCELAPSYFDVAIDTLRSSGAFATGHVVDIPANPGWIEAAWHDLHFRGNARDVAYINTANLFVDRTAFNRVSGFREELVTGEDAELGQRLNAAGFRMYANPAVRAIHLDNPKTLRQFFRRQVWHGIGMFGTVGWKTIDKPTTALMLHLAATIAGLIVVVTMSWPLVDRLALAAALQLVAPGLTVVVRLLRARRITSVVPGVFLYWLYYWARAQALLVIVFGKGRRYRK